MVSEFQEKLGYALAHAQAGKPYDPEWVGKELLDTLSDTITDRQVEAAARAIASKHYGKTLTDWQWDKVTTGRAAHFAAMAMAALEAAARVGEEPT
jgi:hypothetical protein